MNNQKFITQIRDHIADDQLGTALQLLSRLLENSPQLDEVIQQAGRYASIREQIRLGTVNHEDKTLTENQIRMGLIDLVSEIERQGEQPHLRKEIEQAVISIQNSKNINTGNIEANTVDIGDKTTINIKGIWIGIALLFIALLALGIWQQDTLKQWTGFDRVFKKNDKNFTILILPFKSLCEYEGRQYDVGYVIKERLEGIIADESLKVMPFYISDYDVSDFNDIKAKELQKYHYADMIVYGTYQTDDCSSEGDKICLNYMTDQKWSLGEMSTDLDRNYKSGGLDELQKGKIQEKVEDIATFLSVIAQQKNIDHERYMGILQDFLKQKDTGNYSKAVTYVQLADQLKSEGKLDEVLDLYQKALEIYKEKDDKRNIGLCYERIGTVYRDLGDLDKALKFYEQSNELDKQLYESYPQNVSFKNGLAIAYSKLGETHSSLGNLKKALKFFEDETVLFEQLYESYPQNVSFKNGLAVSYSKLGDTHTSLGNLKKALKFFELRSELGKQLYESYPQNVSFKNGLAIAYSKLGETHSSLGNLQKALQFFELDAELSKQLYESYPQNVSFKNGLAISYSKLGDTHASLGNLQKALQFFELRSELGEQLYESYPQNVSFKNGLAVSYAKLGVFNKNQLKDNQKAKIYFQQAHDLWRELTTDYPAYVEFQRNFENVKRDLENL